MAKIPGEFFAGCLCQRGRAWLLTDANVLEPVRQTVSVSRASRSSLGKFRIPAEEDFNPRSPWGERPCVRTDDSAALDISIHAPRGGSDVRNMNHSLEVLISIHAPRGGSDGEVTITSSGGVLFQSTLPVGGATNGNRRK